MLNLDKTILIQAINQVTMQKAIFAASEKQGCAIFAAIEKAELEILYNASIEFENGVLTFVSRNSKKPRMVTKNGCHESCDCKNQISYHAAMFWILEAYQALLPEPAKPLNIQKSEKLCGNCKSRVSNNSGKCFVCEGSTSPYLKSTTGKKTESLAGVRF